MKKLYLLPIIILFMATGCDWDFSPNVTGTYEEKLPEITTTGEHTFGCKIDGEVFLPDFYSFMLKQSLFSNIYKNEITIKAKNNVDDKWTNKNIPSSRTYVEIIFNKINDIYINESAKITLGKIYEDNVFKGTIYKDSDTGNNFEVLRFDTNSTGDLVFSCTFNAVVHNENNDTIVISDGRFDVKLN